MRSGTRYPATLLLTGDHDDRVVPGHSFKFAAALQAAQGGDQPILIRVDTAAGSRPGVAGGRVDPDQDRLVSALSGLQRGRELERVAGTTRSSWSPVSSSVAG